MPDVHNLNVNGINYNPTNLYKINYSISSSSQSIITINIPDLNSYKFLIFMNYNPFYAIGTNFITFINPEIWKNVDSSTSRRIPAFGIVISDGGTRTDIIESLTLSINFTTSRVSFGSFYNTNNSALQPYQQITTSSLQILGFK